MCDLTGWHFVSSLVGCLSQWGLLAYLSLQPRRTSFAMTLASLCAVFIGWTFAAAAFHATGELRWHWVDVGISPAVPPLGLALVAAFTGAGPEAWRKCAFVAVAFGALASAGWLALGWAPARDLAGSDAWPIVYMGLFLPTITWAILMLRRHQRMHAADRAEWIRGRGLLWGIIVATSLAITELLADLGVAVPRLGHIASLTTCGMIAWLGARRGLLARPTRRAWLGATVAIGALSGALALLLRFVQPCGRALVGAALLLGLSGLAIVAVGRALHRVRSRSRDERLALVGRMSAQLAHDLRNPLAALLSAVEYLEEDERRRADPDETRGAMIRLAREQTGRLREVTDRYVELTRAGPVDRQPIGLRALVSQSWAATRRDQAPAVPDLSVWIDGPMVSGALQNLLANASEAARSEVSVRVHALANDLEIEVRDDGPGMNPREVELARVGFFTTKTEGSGLGVSFAAEVARAHGGRLDIDSRLGRGTRVRLVLADAIRSEGS